MKNKDIHPYLTGYGSHVLAMVEFRKSDNPILSKEIQNRVGISGERLRAIIHSARADGNIPVCSDSKGYYMPRDKIDADRTIRSLLSRAKQLKEAADGIEKHYNKDDQMRLL